MFTRYKYSLRFTAPQAGTFNASLFDGYPQYNTLSALRRIARPADVKENTPETAREMP